MRAGAQRDLELMAEDQVFGARYPGAIERLRRSFEQRAEVVRASVKIATKPAEPAWPNWIDFCRPSAAYLSPEMPRTLDGF